MAGIFRFKQFSVDQTGCAMKINTDGVLLGALTQARQPQNILDIGTGTGVIALMLAQRFPNALIDAVEIDESAAQTASLNFQNSPYANRLKNYQGSFETFFVQYPEVKYNLIVSNPPFYINSLVSPGAGKALAKHAGATFFELLVNSVAQHLAVDGTCWLVLPLPATEQVVTLAGINELYLQQVISIKSYPASNPHRQLLCLGRQQTKTAHSEFVIYDEPKQYSAQYKTAMHNFFTIFP